MLGGKLRHAPRRLETGDVEPMTVGLEVAASPRRDARWRQRRDLVGNHPVDRLEALTHLRPRRGGQPRPGIIMVLCVERAHQIGLESRVKRTLRADRSGPVFMPGHVLAARSHARSSMRLRFQNGQVRHCFGRSSYTPHTARPGTVVRSRKMQSCPNAVSRSVKVTPPSIGRVYWSTKASTLISKRTASAACSSSSSMTVPGGPVQQLPHMVHANRKPLSEVRVPSREAGPNGDASNQSLWQRLMPARRRRSQTLPSAARVRACT